ncbi:MAG: PIN domain-containing protein [Pirellulales bacterium]
MKYLVDTDVLSEPTKRAPDALAVGWLRRNEQNLAISLIVLGELEYGILLLPAGRRRTRLEQWFAQGIRRIRALEFDTDAASAWAGLLARLKKKGHAMPGRTHHKPRHFRGLRTLTYTKNGSKFALS